MAGTQIILPPIKRGSASVTIRVKLYQVAAGNVGATGLTGASAGMLITVLDSVSAGGGTLTYSAGSGNIQTIATIGTYAAPSASNCRFGEISATNFNGIYELQFLDTVFDGGKFVHIQIKATAIAEADYLIPLTEFDPYDVVRAGLTAFPNVASGAAGAILTNGTGTAQLSTAAGLVTVGTNNDKTGYSLSQTFPTNFSALVISVTGLVDAQLSEDQQNEIYSISDVLGYVNDIGVAGNGLTAIPWNPAWDAEVESEVIDALQARGVTTTRTGYLDNLSAGAVALASTALSTVNWTNTRAGHLDNLNIGGNVSSSDEVTAIQNNTRVGRVVPQVIERPDSGTTLTNIELYLYDAIGNMEAPDSAPTIDLKDQAGNDLSARLDSTTMALVSTGKYRAVYTSSTTDDLEQLVWTFSVVEGGATRIYGNQTIIVDTSAVDFSTADRSKLEAVFNKLPSKNYLTGTSNSDGDVQLDEATGAARSDLRLLNGEEGWVIALQSQLEEGNLSHLEMTAARSILLDKLNIMGNVAGALDLTEVGNTVDGIEDTIGVSGAGLTAIPWTVAFSNGTLASAQTALVSYNLDHLVKIAVDADWATTVHLDSVIGHLADNGTTATFDRTTDSQEAIRDRGDAAWITATGFSTHTVSDVWEYVINGSAPFAGQAQYALFNSNYGIGQTYTLLLSVNTNVNSVLVDTNELQVDWTNGGRLDNILDARASQTSVDELPTNTELALRTLVAADYATSTAVQTVDDLVDDIETRLTATRAAYLDKLNISGNVASSAEVTSIQNNTRVVRVVNSTMERPDAGTMDYRVELLLYDEVGNMEAPDSAPTIELVNQSGTDLSSRLDSATMALVETGRYRAIYTASAGDDLEQLVWTFSVVEGGATRKYGNTTLLVDTSAVDFTSADRAKLDTLHDTRLTAGRAANLDNLNAMISSRSSHSLADVLSGISGDHGVGSYIRNTEPLNLSAAAIAGQVDITLSASHGGGSWLTGGSSSLTAQQVWEYGTRILSAFSFDVTLATAQALYAPSKAGDLMGIVDGGITETKITLPAETAGRPTGIFGMLRRGFEWVCNPRNRDRSTGVVTLRNAADTATLETQTQSTSGDVDTQTKGV